MKSCTYVLNEMGKDWFVRAVFPCTDDITIVHTAVWLRATKTDVEKITKEEALELLKKHGWMTPPPRRTEPDNYSVSGCIEV